MTRTTTDQPAGGAAAIAAAPLVHDPAVGGRRRPGGGIVPVLAFAGIVVAVMQTLLVPVIKDLPVLLNTAPSNATWMLTATLLAGAVATPIMGRLGDLNGKRRMLLTSLAIMVVGSLVCGFTDDLVTMIVGRALQGFAMGAIPLGIGIMRDELPRERLGAAMGLMSSSIGVGGGLALPVAALVAQHADWHTLFFGAAGLGVLSILLTLLVVPETAVRAQGRFDVAGALGLSAGLVALLLPITKGSDWGWGSPTTLGLFGLAALILVLWGVLELRRPDPLVDLRTTARREVLLTNLASITVGVAFYAVSLVLPQLLQLPTSTGYGLGQSMVVAGLCMAPLGLTMMCVAPLYARIAARRGPKVSLMLGMLVIAIGYGAGMGLMAAAWQTVIIAVVLGAGIGLAYSSLPALIIGAVDPSETGAANGLNTLMRSIGTSVSSAVIGMVLAHMSTRAGDVTVPTMAGFRVSFLIATAAVLVGVALASFLPSQLKASRGPALVAQSPDGTEDVEQHAVAHGPPGPQAVGTVPVAGTLPGAAAPAEGAEAAGRLAVVGADRVTDHVAGFRGRVADTSGTPVPGASITLIDRQGRQAGVTTAGAEGHYALGAPAAGAYVLTAAAPGHAPHAASATCRGAGPSTRVDLVLSGDARLHGTLFGGPEGTPLDGGSVVVTDTRGDVVACTASGADGSWEVAQLPPGAYTLVLSALGHRPQARAWELSGGEAERLDARLQPSATVRGTVRGPGGRPLADAAVTLVEDGTVAGHTVTGPDGVFAFTELTGSHYTLTAVGYPPHAAPISLTGGADALLDLELAQPPATTG
ncbi:Carboxypeptidase regulatory-like domain-containing protein [Streptomyces sp. 2323.1]|uniref:MFS transporter n=1 Tax=Streptomyces sp. 2323.1 TaxID=1938841 RepID=UPI000BBF6B53|nr:MFS transporter [Streptomyces sp. 2323.1]SOE09436.1 Carboxypeptidase regulatory-like domain-containing protein [Streptomyces sp. 2323.1]